MVREDEHRGVKRQVVSPPPFPFVIWPGTTNGTEHVPAYDPRAYPVKPPGRKIVVNAPNFSA
jgi:hypothetical protein